MHHFFGAMLVENIEQGVEIDGLAQHADGVAADDGGAVGKSAQNDHGDAGESVVFFERF